MTIAVNLWKTQMVTVNNKPIRGVDSIHVGMPEIPQHLWSEVPYEERVKWPYFASVTLGFRDGHYMSFSIDKPMLQYLRRSGRRCYCFVTSTDSPITEWVDAREQERWRWIKKFRFSNR